MAFRASLAAGMGGRRGWILLVLAAVVAVGAAAAGAGERLDRILVGSLARQELSTLAELGGFRTDEGTGPAHRVTVVQDGGPLWVAEVTESAVESEAAFEVGESTSLLRVELVQGWGVLGLQLHLWRRSWQLRGPHPATVGNLPVLGALWWVAAMGVARWRRRLPWGFAIAGLGVQFSLALLPRPEVLQAPTLTEAWSRGPLMTGATGLASQLDELGVAVAIGVVVLCLVLVAFDHRRSRNTSRDLGLAWASAGATVTVAGLVMWVEGCLRSGWGGMVELPLGAVSLAGCVLALAAAITSRAGDPAPKESS